MKPEIIYVDDNNTLVNLCEQWQKLSSLSLDTEFIRTDTFYPIPALLQIYDGNKCYLLDLVALTDFSALATVLENSSIIKVLHSCSEDLEIFETLIKTLPSPVFDTQIAAAFLGYGFSVGYSKLVKAILDIEASKDESRSNWLQRPLTADQIEYAALDVIYLHKIYLHFRQQLVNSEKADWVNQAHQEMLQNYQLNQCPEHYFHRFKSAWRLTDDKKKTLFQLCLWREKEARRRNKPRNRIMRDEILFDHALHNTLPNGYSMTDDPAYQTPSVEIPLPREAGELLKKLKHLIEKNAVELNIAPEVLGRKKDLTNLISSGITGNEFQLPASLTGWRKHLVGNDLLKMANEWKVDH